MDTLNYYWYAIVISYNLEKQFSVALKLRSTRKAAYKPFVQTRSSLKVAYSLNYGNHRYCTHNTLPQIQNLRGKSADVSCEKDAKTWLSKKAHGASKNLRKP